MTVRVLYFARIREELGLDAETVEITTGMTVGDVLDELAGRHRIVQLLSTSIRAGLNDRYVGRSAIVKNGDEIAVLTPVSGG